jgi:hypothetical protein
MLVRSGASIEMPEPSVGPADVLEVIGTVRRLINRVSASILSADYLFLRLLILRCQMKPTNRSVGCCVRGACHRDGEAA